MACPRRRPAPQSRRDLGPRRKLCAPAARPGVEESDAPAVHDHDSPARALRIRSCRGRQGWRGPGDRRSSPSSATVAIVSASSSDAILEIGLLVTRVRDAEGNLERCEHERARAQGMWRAAAVSRRDAEAEAHSAHRLDPARITELPTQSGDVDVDRLRAAVPRRLPDLARGSAAWRRRLPGSRASRASRSNSFGVSSSSRSPSVTVRAGTSTASSPTRTTSRLARRRRPACDRPNPREQLAEPERLDEIVVGAHLEPDDLVDLLALGGDHDDRDARAGAELPAHRQAVHVGQAEVEQDEVGLASRQRRAARWPRARRRILRAGAPRRAARRSRPRPRRATPSHSHGASLGDSRHPEKATDGLRVVQSAPDLTVRSYGERECVGPCTRPTHGRRLTARRSRRTDRPRSGRAGCRSGSSGPA